MKSLTRSLGLLKEVLADAETSCLTATTRDYVTIVSRVKHEGWSFLTITLPAFEERFTRSLEVGKIVPSEFLGFKRSKNFLSLPAFLQGLTARVFDTASGDILPEPCVNSIMFIRQICLMHKKVNMPCTPQRVNKAIERFVKNEAEIAAINPRLDPLYGSFLLVSRLLVSKLFADFEVGEVSLKPKHGPGATSDRKYGNQKFILDTWSQRLQCYLPLDAFVFSGYEHMMNITYGLDSLRVFDPSEEPPVKVITVPKTLKAPRVIAIETTYMQYAQQSLMEYIVSRLETCSPTSGHVNFRDQLVNRNLALEGSKTGRFATIDLSDASDRVRASVVSDMLRAVPLFRGAVFSCRSSRARLPNGITMPLRKFASMGSALCFPMEALVFFAIAITSELARLNLKPSFRNIYDVSRGIYVYGDDIIVNVEAVECICALLERFALKVSATKTFRNGKFRESCGMDAFNGTQVTPVYVRERAPSDAAQTAGLVSWISLGNQLYKAGYWRASNYVCTVVEKLTGRLPIVQETSPGLGWHCFGNPYEVQRWSSRSHTWLVKTLTVVTGRQKDPLTSYPALMKFFLKKGIDPIQDRLHLESSVRRGFAKTYTRWVQPY